jgi:hypothetical protein
LRERTSSLPVRSAWADKVNDHDQEHDVDAVVEVVVLVDAAVDGLVKIQLRSGAFEGRQSQSFGSVRDI